MPLKETLVKSRRPKSPKETSIYSRQKMVGLSGAVVKKLKKAPQKPGIYLFRDHRGQVLYVGKAINLRHRLSFYTRFAKASLKTQLFLAKAEKVNWIIVRSEIESLLLEMNLIKQLKPPYNLAGRDDKRPAYLVITKEALPKIKISRLPKGKEDFFGPFPSLRKLHQILKALRPIFSFCTCQKPKNSCLYAKLGLCRPVPLATTSSGERQQYLKQIRQLKLFLSGRVKQVLANLNKEMKALSLNQDYEKAAQIRDQISAINELLARPPQIASYLASQVLQPNLPQARLQSLETLLCHKPIVRIEGYDVANLGGRLATASMVAFVNGMPDSSQYRRFKIRLPALPNDPAMISHALARRLKHREWPLPDLILIDGGKTQLSRCQKVINQPLKIKLVGLAKREETLILPPAASTNGQWR
ncbi:hypothetical protein A2160_01605 [Candidatus Beckwithbacteria bacterium RBG_13_42_9]|uniref:Excinuclease ABC subunit C n=1 Tax=Candidatus Beckwithbacteria bacterium RBG_13_42_9 TaxID=1797457 RepID=A0A1F5E974_9BACT|nr:MAG: hypothetical protein A2160_01605 [Candidatus Beckwithbacteria bacterium RBG_13_42_9]